jgi:2-polyprenyl-6-methoxyphenol hydroxylase-like FAD-dependent oxidoreductase
MTTQVTIVGAGPTGAMLGIELARRGVEVRILDKQPERSRETRAIGIHARTLELFEQLGIVEEFLARGHRVRGFTVHTGARRSTQLRFDRLDTRYPFVLLLGQNETQGILDQQLERLGVTIERGVNVVGLDPRDDGVELTIAGAGGDKTLCTEWVVGCDGAHSIVRRSLGLSFDGGDYGQDWLMAEVKLDPPIDEEQFHVFSYTDAPMVTFPLPSGSWRVFLPQVPNRAGERRPPDIEEIERLAARRGPAGMTFSEPTLLATFRCYHRSTETMRRGRMLIAGDAAHIHSPAGGQGMNTGLHDAVNLGWKLALVTRRLAPPALLDTYEAERLPIAAGVLGLTHQLVRLFTIRSPRKRWLRDRLLPVAMSVPSAERRYMRRLSQLSHNYRRGPLSEREPVTRRRGIVPGDRVPLACANGGGTAFHNVMVLDGQLLLVRPDGYLACRAPLNRPDIPERYLERLLSYGSPAPVTAR